MTSRQRHILRVLSRFAVGTIVFCLTLPLVLIPGAILLSLFLPVRTEAFFPPEFVALFLLSAAIAMIAAIFIAKKLIL